MHYTKKLVACLLVSALMLSCLSVAVFAETSGDYEYAVNEDGTVTITAYSGNDKDVVIPAKLDDMDVTAIGDSAFSGNSSMETVVFPDTLKTIGKDAFEACISLKAVEFPESVESIGSSAFFNCMSLAAVTSTPYLNDIGYQALHNTSWFMQAPNGFLYVGRVLYAYKGITEKNFVVTVPDYTSAIAPGAFDGQYNIYEIYLPVGIRTIGKYAFKNCYSLNGVRIPPSVSFIGDYAFLNADAAIVRSVYGSYVHSYTTEHNVLFDYDTSLEYLDGDMDKDGTVSSTDIRLLMKAVILGEEYDHERFLSCDIVYDGKIATDDIRQWMKLTIL